ncbi:MAG: ATP-binding protein [Lachnospiraceae bacterium]|nr:ATP-binding protein [Lachnospiraceae bacterium]
MAKAFNVTADCKPDKHYMVNIDGKLVSIKKMIDAGDYFTINRARQYGKTTTLRALSRYLQKDYHVVLLDFQTISNAKFEIENQFSLIFAKLFLRGLKMNLLSDDQKFQSAIGQLELQVREKRTDYELPELFDSLAGICASSDKPIVLMIDEVDSATNNQVFLDFLAQLRAYYIDRDVWPSFQAVILAGVYDVKNLKRKIRTEEDHKVNSPWNIAADFNVDMSFSKEEIEGMLQEYEKDHHTGMDTGKISGLLYDYTSGYPFLVSKLCKLMDEEVIGREGYENENAVWTKNGFCEAVTMILTEKNSLFESLSEKLISFPELNTMLKALLFTGKNIVYNFYEPSINVATMFGFVKNQNGILTISNRIFETWLYNLYLSAADMQSKEIYTASLQDKNQFIVDGHLNMQLILEKFVEHFHELYGDSGESFIEEEGRKYFLLYLRPIINGTGNYYIESQTRGLRRTDIIVDYRGEQYIIEMKIWRGEEYNNRGEKQLVGYLDDYDQKKGYMLSFNFNKKKKIGVQEIIVEDKVLIEAVV